MILVPTSFLSSTLSLTDDPELVDLPGDVAEQGSRLTAPTVADLTDAGLGHDCAGHRVSWKNIARVA